MATPELHEWNLQALALVQALLGAISPNVRMVSLGRRGQDWIIQVVLERDDARDREEMDDVAAEFEALQEGPIACALRVEVDPGEAAWPAEPTRVVFRRRET